LLHLRRGRAAAMDHGLADPRLPGRGASEVRSCQGGGLSRQDHHRAPPQGPGALEGHGDATAPRAGDGHRREAPRAGRADARPRHPLPQAVLRFPAERLLRPRPHHPADHAPGRRGPARPDRRRLHRPRADRLRLLDGRGGVALPGAGREPRKGRVGADAQADARAPGARPPHPALRRRRPRVAVRSRRGAHPRHRRLVRGRGRRRAGSGARSGSMSTVPAIPATRTLYWAVRREVWENRSIYLAPLAVAGVVLLGFLISTIGLPARVRAASADPMQQYQAVAQPYVVAAVAMMLTTLAVGVFYSLDALYGERRDR